MIVVIRVERAFPLHALSPNPVRTQAEFAVTVKPTGRAQVLYNLLGRHGRQVDFGNATVGRRHTVEIATQGLSSGTYFVRLSAPGGTRTQKDVVLR